MPELGKDTPYVFVAFLLTNRMVTPYAGIYQKLYYPLIKKTVREMLLVPSYQSLIPFGQILPKTSMEAQEMRD